MVIEQQKREKLAQSNLNDSSLFNSPVPYLQQFAFKPATNKNIKPIAGLRPATLLVAGLINNCCSINWEVGDRVMHNKFGESRVSNLLGTGDKMYLAVTFSSQSKKIIDPKLAPI